MIKLQRIILESPPIKPIILWSKRILLPGFEKIPLYDVVTFFLKQTQQIGLNERAASISFNFLMAVPPLLIFLFTLLSYIPGSKSLYTEILVLLNNVIPDDTTYQMIKKVMDDFFAGGTGTLSFGLLLAIYFSSNATLTIMRTFRKSMLHIEVEDRNFIQVRWSAIRLTAIIILLLLATILIMLTQTVLLKWVYNKVYGSLGSILILMFLVFVNSLVLLIGFELNVSINSLKRLSEKRNQTT